LIDAVYNVIAQLSVELNVRTLFEFIVDCVLHLVI